MHLESKTEKLFLVYFNKSNYISVLEQNILMFPLNLKGNFITFIRINILQFLDANFKT